MAGHDSTHIVHIAISYSFIVMYNHCYIHAQMHMCNCTLIFVTASTCTKIQHRSKTMELHVDDVMFDCERACDACKKYGLFVGQKAYNTLGSRVVPHPSTDKAKARLTSEF